MNQRSVVTLIVLAWLACFVPGCAKLSESPSLGTNTNWLKACSAHGECTDGRSCLCGVCTLPCSSDGQCGSVHEATRCAALSEDSCGGGAASTSACLEGCRSSADCTSLEHSLCRDGLCVPAPGVSADSGAPDAGTTTGGSGLELSRSGATVIITDSYTACDTHSDCSLVGTSCNGCCEQGAIHQRLLQSYAQHSEQACADYEGAICDCEPQDLVARCEAGRCRAFERATLDCYSPTRNLERAYDDELVGCTCTWPDAWVCARPSTRDVALRCTRVPNTSTSAWAAANDGPCAPLPIDQTCSRGAIRASAAACLDEFQTCDLLESGEFCGR